MPQTSLIDFMLLGSAYIFGWVIVDVLASLFLSVDAKGCKFRFIGMRWLKRETAVKVALAQFIIAFIISYFIYDYLFYLFSLAQQYVIPIGMTAIGVVYLYILGSLPYKITPKRCTFSIVFLFLAAILFYAISQST
jgi:hypothetical protein